MGTTSRAHRQRTITIRARPLRQRRLLVQLHLQVLAATTDIAREPRVL